MPEPPDMKKAEQPVTPPDPDLASRLSPHASNRFVVVAEDDEGLRRVVCKWLERHGLTTLGVHSGADALAAVQEHPDCLLLLDYILPDLNAQQLLNKLGELNLHVPFIVMTGRGDERVAVEMMKLGARDYIVKQVDFTDLLVPVVERVLAQLATEERLATSEKALRESEVQNQALIRAFPDILFLNRLDGEFLAVHTSHPELLFAPPEAFLHRKVKEIMPKPLGDSLMKAFADALDLEVMQELNYVLPIGDEKRHYEARVTPCTRDTVITVVRDVTERKQAEAALAESELKFRTVFESSSDAMMLLDSEKFLDCNDATLRVFGYSTRDEFLGRHPGEVSPPLQADGRESRIAADENIAAAFRNGRNFFEWLHQRADGTVFPADVLLTPLGYHGRKVLQATVRDITERKLAETEITQKNAQLIELNKEKNQLLGMAAHDLRNPLSLVSTASAYLLDDASRRLPEARRAEFLRRINSGSKFMLKLIDDLLDVAKIEAGRLDLEIRDEDLCGLIEDTLALNRMLADKKRIRLDFTPGCGLPPLRFDRGKVEQVLNNLVSNALKFSAPGTAVAVQVSRVNGTVVVSVRDQGQGIPAEELDKLFRPFSRTSVRSTAGETSTGLGLAICRKIVEGHGGRIWAESELGHGSTFSFSLPVASDESQASDLKSQTGKEGSTAS